MREIIYEFVGSTWFVISMKVYLFLILTYIVYSTLNYFKYYSRMQKTLQSIYNQMSDQEKARAELERQQRDIQGEGIKQDLLGKIDEELAYSGIKDHIKWMTTELFLVISMTLVAVDLILVTPFFGLFYGIASAVGVVVLIKLVITIMANLRDRETEKSLLQLMNIMENFSKSSDDLVDILDKSSRYIDDPLRTQVFRCVQQARNTGDSLTALQDLQEVVKNKHFKILIRNLETSSRFESNYADIIEDCRDIFHDYIRAQKEKRAIRLNGVMEIGVMICTGVACLILIGNMTDDGDVIKLLLSHGTTGFAIFVFLIASMIVAAYLALFQVIRND